MAETPDSPLPVIAQGQTTAAGENARAAEAQPEPVAGAADVQPASGIWNNWLLYAAILMWGWWLFTNKKRKAQREEEKKEKERRENIRKGDRLVTIGRLHGVVSGLTDDTVIIKPDSKSDVTLTFDRQAIHRVMPRPGEEGKEDRKS